MISLKKVDYSNIHEVLKLSVAEEQKNFVASNIDSIVEAYLCLSQGTVALPFGIYAGDTLVGFVMFGYGFNAEEPKVCRDAYCLWRFMIDKDFQHKGYGREALKAAIDFMASCPSGPADHCWLCYEPENLVAKKLYESEGFTDSGAKLGNEIVAVRPL